MTGATSKPSGRSLLTIRRTTETGERRQLDPSPTDPWRITFVRTPRAIVGFQPTQIVAPSRASAWSVRGSGLLAPILGVFGAAIVAVVMHQWMFMIFGLLGVFVACGQWIAGRLGHRKTQRRDRVSEQMTLADFGAALTRESARYRTYHHSTTMQLDRALAWAASVAPQLWSVRATHSDAFRVTIGRGDVSWAPTVTGIDADTTSQVRPAVDVVSLLRAVMVPAFLGSDSVVSLCGDRGMATAVARSLIVQLAAASGPADWGCAIVLGDDRTMRGCDPNWEAFDWLPHMILNEARTSTWSDWSLVTALNCSASTERHLVLIVNDAQLLSARTSPLRRLLASDRSLAMIVICDSFQLLRRGLMPCG